MFRSLSASTALAAAFALAGCSARPPGRELAAAQPTFDVAQFFRGRSEGDARLKIVFKSAEPVRVRSNGVIGADGTLVLTQSVIRGTRAPEERQWHIRQIGSGRYAGTLSDAAGSVTGDVSGNRLHLSFPMKGGVHADQWIYLQAGGRIALNRMRMTKFGIEVARLDETIRKLD